MTKNYPILFYSLICILCAFACKNGEKKDLPLSEGMPGEVLVITSEDNGNNIQKMLEPLMNVADSILVNAEKTGNMPMESANKFWFRTETCFDGIERNAPIILLINEAGKFSKELKNKEASGSQQFGKTTIEIYTDIWAKPQTVLLLKQQDLDLLAKELKEGLNSKLKDLIYSLETKQGLPGNIAANAYSDSVKNIIKNAYGFGITYPPQFRLEFSNNEVVWLWQETSKYYRHILFNTFSDSTKIITKEDAIKNRDFITYKYLKNNENTHTKVSRLKRFPISWQTDVKINGINCAILRGWYQEEGTTRRGPFARYFFHDPANKRYIAMDGFVYAPEMERLTFYRIFDIIAHSFTLK